MGIANGSFGAGSQLASLSLPGELDQTAKDHFSGESSAS
jgi:hypothetical protein